MTSLLRSVDGPGGGSSSGGVRRFGQDRTNLVNANAAPPAAAAAAACAESLGAEHSRRPPLLADALPQPSQSRQPAASAASAAAYHYSHFRATRDDDAVSVSTASTALSAPSTASHCRSSAPFARHVPPPPPSVASSAVAAAATAAHPSNTSTLSAYAYASAASAAALVVEAPPPAVSTAATHRVWGGGSGVCGSNGGVQAGHASTRASSDSAESTSPPPPQVQLQARPPSVADAACEPAAYESLSSCDPMDALVRRPLVRPTTPPAQSVHLVPVAPTTPTQAPAQAGTRQQQEASTAAVGLPASSCSGVVSTCPPAVLPVSSASSVPPEPESRHPVPHPHPQTPTAAAAAAAAAFPAEPQGVLLWDGVCSGGGEASWGEAAGGPHNSEVGSEACSRGGGALRRARSPSASAASASTLATTASAVVSTLHDLRLPSQDLREYLRQEAASRHRSGTPTPTQQQQQQQKQQQRQEEHQSAATCTSSDPPPLTTAPEAAAPPAAAAVAQQRDATCAAAAAPAQAVASACSDATMYTCLDDRDLASASASASRELAELRRELEVERRLRWAAEAKLEIRDSHIARLLQLHSDVQTSAAAAVGALTVALVRQGSGGGGGSGSGGVATDAAAQIAAFRA
eukprot:Rhum_TRINITY_DN14135_c8_g1::Rhum_TRINITY_DN14135_c8_g1_i1::g.70453::m.70453